MSSIATREEIRRLVEVLPEDDLDTAMRVLRGLLAIPKGGEIPFTPEEAAEFAMWEAASDEAWRLIDEELERA